MFCVKEYGKYGIYYYYCRTIEKTKEIFDRIFWEWIKEEICVPQDFGCETWEELLQECWEDGTWDDVVSYEPIVFEEDKS